MDAIAFSPQSSQTQQTHFFFGGSLLYLADNEPRLRPLALLKILPFQVTNLSIRAYANRRFRDYPKRNISSKAFEGGGNTMHKSSETRLSNRERLLALFERIQTSISEEDSRNESRMISQALSDDSSVERAVVDFLQQSSRETKVKRSKRKHNDAATEKVRPKKEKTIQVSQPSSDFRRTRLPSNFMKKSPIPLPTPPRSKDLSVTEAKTMDSETERELSQIKTMKLVELKELAKERGIRGYSKLNKTELLELLRSQVRA